MADEREIVRNVSFLMSISKALRDIRLRTLRGDVVPQDTVRGYEEVFIERYEDCLSMNTSDPRVINILAAMEPEYQRLTT